MSTANTVEREMLALINSERSTRGIAPLQLASALNTAAEDHSDWMLRSDIFSHSGAGGSSPHARMQQAGFELSGNARSGENIGWQSERGDAGISDDIADIHQSLMNSPGHRANILNPDYRYIGIGVEEGRMDGFDAVMVTQNFAATDAQVVLDHGTDSPADLPDDTPVPDMVVTPDRPTAEDPDPNAEEDPVTAGQPDTPPAPQTPSNPAPAEDSETPDVVGVPDANIPPAPTEPTDDTPDQGPAWGFAALFDALIAALDRFEWVQSEDNSPEIELTFAFNPCRPAWDCDWQQVTTDPASEDMQASEEMPTPIHDDFMFC